jgi:hypothetical protein
MTSTSPLVSTLKTCSLSLFDADALSDAVRSSQIEHSQLERGDFKTWLKRQFGEMPSETLGVSRPKLV